MSMTIVEFLTARLDEDEAGAHSSGPARVAWLTYLDDVGRMLYTTVAAEVGHGGVWVADGHELAPPASARVVYDPARVLAEVKAKRRVMERHCATGTSQACDGCGWDREDGYHVEDIEECPELRDLASVYTEHPDYKQEWGVE